MDAQASITAYLSAYRSANGKEPDFDIAYEAGWFVFRSRFGSVESRKRAADLRGMTERLAMRSAENNEPAEAPAPPRGA